MTGRGTAGTERMGRQRGHKILERQDIQGDISRWLIHKWGARYGAARGVVGVASFFKVSWIYAWARDPHGAGIP